MINNVFTKQNFQEEVAKFLPKIFFGTMIAVGLMFVIFAGLIFLSASNPDLLAVKKSPCQNNMAIEEWNECVSTKEYYPTKAFETKDLNYCNSIRKAGRRLEGGVVVDGLYNLMLQAQCKASVSGDIRYCFDLQGNYRFSSATEQSTRYYRAECIIAISQGDINYCNTWMESVGTLEGLSETTCILPITKAKEIQERGLNNELISDAEWQDILQ